MGEVESDGTVVVVHRTSRQDIVGLCEPRVIRHDRGSQVGAVCIDVEPGGWAELEDADEARGMVQMFTARMDELIALAWPKQINAAVSQRPGKSVGAGTRRPRQRLAGVSFATGASDLTSFDNIDA